MPNAMADTLSIFVSFVYMRFCDDFLASLSDSDSANGFILKTRKYCSFTFLVLRLQLFNRFAFICVECFTCSRSIFMRSICASKLMKLSKIVPIEPSNKKIAVKLLHTKKRCKEKEKTKKKNKSKCIHSFH